MIKALEMSSPDSCFNKARGDETIFVMLARDRAFPAAVRAWAAERVRLGLNGPDDPKIRSALEDADHVEAFHETVVGGDKP